MLMSSIQTGFRLGTLELLVYENSSLHLNKSVVALAIRHDRMLYQLTSRYHQMNATQARENARGNSLALYHDWMQDPLCFPAALLIECGFPVTRDVLLMALDDDLHPVELDYLRTCLDGPRRLTHIGVEMSLECPSKVEHCIHSLKHQRYRAK